uniref:Odorant receptor n=1 Tax=Meteorus pulchricornis TaxID=51522 RepID=A0A1S5VFQ1_9HYME|nr:olfactory receptor 58 [Meteorus pulchricornis]
MDTVATPYHRINRIFLSIIGQWPYQTYIYRRLSHIFMVFFTTTHGYFQTAGMIAAWVDLDVFLEAVPTVLADVVCGVKFINFSYNAEKMKKLLVMMIEDWKLYKSGPENDILNDYARFGRRVTMYYAGALYGTMFPMMLVPLVPIVLDIVAPMNESYPKHLMFQQIEFLFDYEKHLFLLLIHGYLGTFAFLTIIIAVDTMFMVYIQHACAKFSILGLYLDRVAKNTDRDIDRHGPDFEDVDYKDMVTCVAKHNDAIEFANLIEEANYFSFVFVIGINMLMMTSSGMVAVFKMNEPNVAMKFVGFTIGEVFHLFYSSWQGELLLDHSAAIFYKAYDSRWNDTSVRSQRLMVPLLMKSATPCKLTAGKSFTMSLQSFSMVIKTSFSYLTVFTSMRA